MGIETGAGAGAGDVAHHVIILIISLIYSKPIETKVDIKLSSDLPQRPYTTLLLTHR